MLIRAFALTYTPSCYTDSVMFATMLVIVVGKLVKNYRSWKKQDILALLYQLQIFDAFKKCILN